MSSGFDQGSYHRAKMKTPVKPKTKLCKISRQMLFANRMIGTMDSFLHVAKHGIYPSENLELHASVSTSRDDGFMQEASVGNTGKTMIPVRYDNTGSFQVFCRPATDFSRGERSDPAQSHMNGMAFTVC